MSNSPKHRHSALRAFLLFGTLLAPLLADTWAQKAITSADRQQAREILQALTEINTTPRYGSTAAAAAIEERMKRAGFSELDVQVVGPSPAKMNVVARLRGSGRGRPILFIAHLDVVEAHRADWSPELDPFKLIEKDGYFYGRGTLDVKGEAASLASNLIRLKQEGYVPARDIVVALTADEEGGGENGVDWLLKNRRDLIDTVYCINTDAGGGQIEKGRRVSYNLQTSEKAYLSFQIEVTNPGGHSSQPVRDNAIYHLAEGLARLAKFDFPVRLNDSTRVFFERMSTQETGPIADDMRAVAQPFPDLAAAARLASASAFYNSVMRTTCVATTLEGGHAQNALPQVARAVVNCRVLPEDSQDAVLKTLTQVLDNPKISIQPLNEMKGSPASPLSPEVLDPIERIVGEMWPGVPVIPVMDPWATDGAYLRRAGMPVYGAPGIFFETDPIRSHGKDERIGVEEFYQGVEFLYRLMKTLGSAIPTD